MSLSQGALFSTSARRDTELRCTGPALACGPRSGCNRGLYACQAWIFRWEDRQAAPDFSSPKTLHAGPGFQGTSRVCRAVTPNVSSRPSLLLPCPPITSVPCTFFWQSDHAGVNNVFATDLPELYAVLLQVVVATVAFGMGEQRAVTWVPSAARIDGQHTADAEQ